MRATRTLSVGFTIACAAVCAVAGREAVAQGAPAAERPDEIVVTSSLIAQPRRRIATAVSVIDAEEIELRGYPDLANVLRLEPGIGVTNAGGFGKRTTVRIRGEEGYRTMLVIDGVKALDPSAPQVEPSFGSLLATSDLQRVEVLRGPQGFLYGADAGGVVNVISKTGAGPFGGRLGLEYGRYDLRKLDGAVSGGNDRGDYFVSVTDLATDGFNAQTSDVDLADADGARNTTVHAKVGLNVADGVRIGLVARDVEASSKYDGCFSPATFAPTNDCRERTDQTTYKISADFDGSRFDHEVGVSGVDLARADFAIGSDAFSTRGEIDRVEYVGSFRPAPALTFVYGLDLERQTLASAPDSFERRQNGYYFEYQGAFADRLFVSAGARYDDSDDFGEHTSTRVSAAYVQSLSGSRSLKYRASYGTGFRAPSLYEMAYNRGPFAFPPAYGVDLAEESSTGYDVGVEYETANALRLELTYFDQRIEDEIYFDLASFSGYLQSPGSSRSHGEEIAFRAPVGRGLALSASLTHDETRDSANRPRLLRPKNLANVGLEYRTPSEKLALLASYRVSRDAVDSTGVAADDYGVLDLSARYALGRALELFGRIENATDERYEEAVGFNTARRSVYGGVRLRF